MTYQDQFHHAHFGWLGAEEGDRTFASLASAEAFLMAQTPGVSRRILDERRRVVAYMHKDGRIEVFGEADVQCGRRR